MADDAESIRITTSWVDLDQTPIQFANTFLIQHQEEEFMLTVGALVPPPAVGGPEEVKAMLSDLPFVPIQTMGRYGMSRRRLVELINVLQDNLAKHDAKYRHGEAP